jgi:hypothetical protein
MTQTNKPVAHTVAAIQALDLDPIKLKLMDPEEGQGWSREYADRMEVAYKRYLTLLAKFPDETIAPTKDVDKFWHGHILDTMKYAEDCENMFGYFLHHFPYSGLRGAQDAADHRVAGEAFHALYEREFGEALPSGSAWCVLARKAAGSGWCVKAPAEKRQAAWCVKAPETKPESAWCVKGPATKADAAWCVLAKQTDVDFKTRPTLSAVR